MFFINAGFFCKRCHRIDGFYCFGSRSPNVNILVKIVNGRDCYREIRSCENPFLNSFIRFPYYYFFRFLV